MSLPEIITEPYIIDGSPEFEKEKIHQTGNNSDDSFRVEERVCLPPGLRVGRLKDKGQPPWPFSFIGFLPAGPYFCRDVGQTEPSLPEHPPFPWRTESRHSSVRRNYPSPFLKSCSSLCCDKVPPKVGLKEKYTSHLFTLPLSLSWMINACLWFFAGQ